MAELTQARQDTGTRRKAARPTWPLFVLSKLGSALIVMWAVATVVFFLARLSGDPVALLLPPEATQAQADTLKATLGLDRPLLVQYGDFLAGVVRFDLGTSLFYNEPVASLIAERIPATLLLAFAALVISLVVAIPAGTFAALRRGRPADTGIISAILVGQSTPAFWVGIVLILIFAVKLQILPASGYGTPAHLVLPAITLAIYSVAVIARLLRSSLIDVLGLDFIRTARAKGMGEGSVVVSHAMRNASLPIVTVVGLEIGSLLGGAILTEQIFAWPGIGRLTIESISNRDFPLVQGVVLLFAATFVIVNLLVDLSYSLLDPESEDRLMTTTAPEAPPADSARRSGARVLRGLIKNRLAVPAFGVLAVIIVVAMFAPLVAPADPNAQDLLQRLLPPAWSGGGTTQHLLGTDQLGRDLLSRLIFGSRISLTVGLIAALISGVIGAVIGLVAGFLGGWFDRVLMRIADIQLAFPSILLALAIVGFLGSSLWNVIVILGVTGWVSYARVIRSEVLSLKERDFVIEAQAIGVRPLTIMRRHLLPNVMAPLVTIGTLQIGSVILAEAALSFLGLGVPPQTVTWGAMLSDGQLYLGTSWWIAVFPGLALTVTVLAINIAGDVLRDLADPRVYRR